MRAKKRTNNMIRVHVKKKSSSNGSLRSVQVTLRAHSRHNSTLSHNLHTRTRAHSSSSLTTPLMTCTATSHMVHLPHVTTDRSHSSSSFITRSSMNNNPFLVAIARTREASDKCSGRLLICINLLATTTHSNRISSRDRD